VLKTRPFETDSLPPYLQPPVPSVFTLEITAHCQHLCAGCGNVFSHTGQDLSAADWEINLQKLQPFIKALRLTGGEPTLHKEFLPILKLVDGLGVPFVLFTNGNWTNPPETLRALSACQNLSGLLVSLHGADPVCYQRFTGVDAFDKTVENLRTAAAAGLKIATNSLLLTTTFEQLEVISELVFSLGVTTASFGRYYGPPLPNLSLDSKQLKTALTTIAGLRKKDERITLSNCVPFCFLPELDFGGGGCTSGFTHCTIGPQGEVRPCTHTNLVLGYLPEADLEAIWSSDPLTAWRQRIPPGCLKCKVLSSCRGGCRALAQQLKLENDPLVVQAIEPLEPVVFNLYADERPKLVCKVVPTDFGYALSGVGHYVTLSQPSGPILQALDGTHTVAEIQLLFGLSSLQLIAALFKKQLLILEE
jgi:radical SAM protein with 4Fe4S-binding SPASM domain